MACNSLFCTRIGFQFSLICDINKWQVALECASWIGQPKSRDGYSFCHIFLAFASTLEEAGLLLRQAALATLMNGKWCLPMWYENSTFHVCLIIEELESALTKIMWCHSLIWQACKTTSSLCRLEVSWLPFRSKAFIESDVRQKSFDSLLFFKWMNAIVKFLAAILGNTLVIQQNIVIIKQKGKKPKKISFFKMFRFLFEL